MNIIRSIAFNILFYAGSLFISTILLWTLLLPENKCLAIITNVYARYVIFIEKYVLNLKLEIRGLENLPKDGKYIIAAKHQSAYETLNMPYMKEFNFPVIILKKELIYIPLWGWYPPKLGFIAINRGSGTTAMRSIIRGSKKSIENGRPVIIYPQGTRAKIGTKPPYKPGIALIYKELKLPIIPIALNSGVFWGKNAFFKKSGTVIFEILPPIESGLKPKAMLKTLEEQIETTSNKLIKEGLKTND